MKENAKTINGMNRTSNTIFALVRHTKTARHPVKRGIR